MVMQVKLVVAYCCICHGQQTGMGQTYKIREGTPEI